MSIDKVNLKALAEETKGWDKLTDAWVCEDDVDETDADLRDWVVGRIDEDGNPYPVATVCTWQYDAPGDAEKLAKYYAAANPAAVLELIAENERLERCEDDLSASVKYWFEACKGAQFEAGVKHADEAASKYIDEHWRPQRDQLKAEVERLTAHIAEGMDHKAVAIQGMARLTAENEQLRAKLEKIRDRPCSVHGATADSVIPNALDAWGRPVPQHLPYDFSGNPGASATQYCNGWNDAGGYWKNHCIDLEQKLAGISIDEKNG